LAVSGLNLGVVDQILAAMASTIEPVDIRFIWRPQLADPGDEMVLEAAVNGRADALISHNTRHFAQGAARFGLLLLRPGEFLIRSRQT
jgi:predicted nucleic acid-binding protein